MLAILSQPLRLIGALPASSCAFQVKTTSLDVIGSPSDQKIHGFRCQVTVRPSAETPPLSVVGTSAASSGMKLALSSHFARPPPMIWSIHTEKLMLLYSPVRLSGSCSYATVIDLPLVSAAVGSNAASAGVQAVGAAVAAGASVAAGA